MKKTKPPKPKPRKPTHEKPVKVDLTFEELVRIAARTKSATLPKIPGAK